MPTDGWTSNPTRSRDDTIILEAKSRMQYCIEWESQARVWFDLDNKFANGDSRNMYQWDNWVVGDRLAANRPCLTVNKTMQHNLLIINDAKQNKPGVNIRPVGETASFEAAQVYQEVVRHIEYISNAESIYDSATTWQVNAGWGYWRVRTDYMTPKSKVQEIYISRIKDPRSVYLDPDINEVDGSDARYGFVFEDYKRDLYEAKYPNFKDCGGTATFAGTVDLWYDKDHVKVAEYYRKTQKEERACYFEYQGQEIEEFYSKLSDDQKQYYNALREREKDLPEYEKTATERPSISDNVEWFKIAGNTIIEKGVWPGIYIPLVRLIGTETVIGGVLDRKGHTRAMLDAQRMYNINTSANVEFGALQTKVPWLAPMAAVEGLEEYWKTANTANHAWLPWNHIDEDGKEIPAPTRPEAPKSSPAYVQQMQIAQNEMMMVSGQYQAQMGENENAKSGVAINARQRQGDRATYHFIDNLAIAVRFTGKILIDLIPKIYDTKRVMRISASDGSIMNVTFDNNHPDAMTRVPPKQTGEQPGMDDGKQMDEIIFNPTVGIYDVQADTGPSFATKRQEAFNAMSQLAASDKGFLQIAGDIYFKNADFAGADAIAARYRKSISPNLTGDGPDQHTEDLMHQASDHIQQLTQELQQTKQALADKTRTLDIQSGKLQLDAADKTLDNHRADYEAETARVVALGNSGPAISREQIEPVLKQLLMQMLQTGDPGKVGPGLSEGGTPIEPPEQGADAPIPGEAPLEPEGEEPPVDGARKAGDGKWYVPNPNKAGGYLRVDQQQA